ncbi:MAG: hypothetical protein ACFFCS_18620 [Candidatus Hodarchaeota archaeon]
MDKIPFSKEELMNRIDILYESTFDSSVNTCKICLNVGKEQYIPLDEGKMVPDDLYGLAKVITFWPYENMVLQCPACGTTYWYKYHYEYFVNGSEEDVTISRQTRVEIRRIIRKYLSYRTLPKWIIETATGIQVKYR